MTYLPSSSVSFAMARSPATTEVAISRAASLSPAITAAQYRRASLCPFTFIIYQVTYTHKKWDTMGRGKMRGTPDPAYVTIAGEYARRIRSGELPPGVQLPSYAEIAERYGVSDIVARKVIELLLGQGLVRSVRRRGIFVADHPNLVRLSPERQAQGVEATFRNEAGGDIHVDRKSEQISATEELADVFGISTGDKITHVVTRVTQERKPVSVSDTYHPLEVADATDAAILEETVADRLPTPTHAEWLRTNPGDLVKTVHQRFIAADGRVIMVSNVSYPRDRYDAFMFRMRLKPDTPVTTDE
jgi:GntR family transcriptional regulator